MFALVFSALTIARASSTKTPHFIPARDITLTPVISGVVPSVSTQLRLGHVIHLTHCYYAGTIRMATSSCHSAPSTTSLRVHHLGGYSRCNSLRGPTRSQQPSRSDISHWNAQSTSLRPCRQRSQRGIDFCLLELPTDFQLEDEERQTSDLLLAATIKLKQLVSGNDLYSCCYPRCISVRRTSFYEG
jgi:hypothetical protein